MSNQPQPIRIVVADDHPIVREGLSAVINREPGLQVVAEATDGIEVMRLCRQHRPDIVLMDLRMPSFSGIEATLLLRSEIPSTKVIVLSTFGGDDDIHKALTAGARAYLLKGTDPATIVSTIRSVHNGHRHIPAEVTTSLLQHFDGNELTAREVEILTLIVRGYKNRGIGAQLGITEGTVKGHINSILGKLGVTDRTQAATAAIRRGIVHLE